MLKPNFIICLMGPTCAGKTALALRLYEQFPVEIVSVDSVMVYRGLDIGSAKPSPEIRAVVPHHLVDICDPAETYSAGNFCTDAIRVINRLLQQGKIPLLVGGTMLYYQALQQGLADLPSKDEKVRQALTERINQEGLAALYHELGQIDAVAAQRINRHDPQRIVRALEVYQVTGKPMSYWWQQGANAALPYPVLNIGLLPERDVLPQQIAERFQQMLDQGFIDEVKCLYERGDLSDTLPAIKSVGYKQAWQFLKGEIDYATMREWAIIATRQLAKRQFTWLRSWPELHVFAANDPQQLDKVSLLLAAELS